MFRPCLIALVILALAASPAAAATVEDLKACYVSAGPTDGERETIVVRGENFTQESTVEVLFDGVPAGNVRTGSVGEFEIRLMTPFQPAGERPLVVTVRDAAGITVVKPTRVTNLAVKLKPRRALPQRRVRFRGRGFTLAAPVFAHYVFAGREQKTVRLARDPASPCGNFSVRRRLIPIDDARTGKWVMQIDQRRAYAPEPDPVWVRHTIDVERVFLEP